MHIRRWLLAASSAAAVGFALPMTAALAAEATGCSGEVVSIDATGLEIGRASAPGPGGTQADPLPIDPAGTVQWSGSTDAVITNGTWSVTVAGVPLMSGDFDNSDGTTSASGTTDLSTLPLAAVLKGKQVIPVTGAITGAGGACSGSGFITGTGSPTSAPMFDAGLVLTAAGVAMSGGMLAATKAVMASGGAA